MGGQVEMEEKENWLIEEESERGNDGSDTSSAADEILK